MFQVEGQVATERASRYLVQLCRHLDQMTRMRHHAPVSHAGGMPPKVVSVEYSNVRGNVRFVGGQVILEASPEGLQLTVEGADEAALRSLQDGLAGRIERIGRRDALSVAWQPRVSAIPHAATKDASSSASGKRRSARLPFVIVVAAAIAIAIHLALFGSTLTALWNGWGTVGISAVVFLGCATAVAHLLLGGAGMRLARHPRPFARRNRDGQR